MSYLDFLNIWHQVVLYGAFVFWGLAILIYLAYKIRFATVGDLKAKFDFASESEVKWYQVAHHSIAVGIFLFLNQLRQETMEFSFVWFFIRLFTTFCMATLYGYVTYLVFKYYYPKPLNKKLKKLRYTARVNPTTGNKMKLLSEEEEDAYLDEGMQAEENAFSVDYDVWIDPETEFTKIEKYKGHLEALECDRCGFQTLKLVKEEIIKQPSEFADGEIKKEYQCSYCNRIKRNTVRLNRTSMPQIDLEGTAQLIDDPLTHVATAVSVKVELVSQKGLKKNYEFQNTKEASKFLSEFDLAKLEEEE